MTIRIPDEATSFSVEGDSIVIGRSDGIVSGRPLADVPGDTLVEQRAWLRRKLSALRERRRIEQDDAEADKIDAVQSLRDAEGVRVLGVVIEVADMDTARALTREQRAVVGAYRVGPDGELVVPGKRG